MKRHLLLLLGLGLAIGIGALVLWPRRAELPAQPEIGQASARSPDPAALQPREPGREPAKADAVRPVGAAADLKRGSSGIVPPELRGALEAQAGSENPPGTSVPPPAPSAGAEKPAGAMHQDPRMAAYKQGIKDSIAKVKPRIAECYASALKQDSTLAGSIKITFEIKAVDGGGRVVSGEVPGSELRSPFFEACVLEKVGGAEFPEPLDGGTVKVTYPFHFDPGGGWGGAQERR